MELFGLIGEKLGHSLSPEIHESLFEKVNIDGKYNLFSIKRENIKNAVESLKTLGIKGANVTIPYKEEIISQLDYISDEAKKIGAINTIFIKGNKSYGYNTDYYGFKEMLLKDNVEIEGKVFYVLGSGGASKAIVYCLLDAKASKVVLVSRDKQLAKEKFNNNDIDFINYDELENIEKAYAVINTTPWGMYPSVETTAIDKSIFENFEVACDIVYNPEETRFLREAKEKGLKTVTGLYMLVAQAMKAEEIWNNFKVDNKIEIDIYEKLREKFI